MTLPAVRSELDYKEAVNRALLASHSYYNSGDIIISDQEYDNLLLAIKEFEIANPLLVISHNLFTHVASGVGVVGKIKHSSPMLSLDNLYDHGSVLEWCNSKVDPLVDKYGFTVEPKIDGLSLSVSYRDGKLVSLATRGDGDFGEDVTYAAGRIVNLPNVLKESVTIDVRGEVFFTKEDYEKANRARIESGKSSFVNARNAASGMLRTEELEHDVRLTFYMHGIAQGSKGLWIDELDYLYGLGVPVNQNPRIYICSGAEEVLKAIDNLRELRDGLGYEIDGCVIKTNSIDFRDRVGSSLRAPRWGVAYKFPAEEVTSKLLDVVWTVGRTGRITPRARITPCFVGGATLEYATLHNASDISRKGFLVGDTVLVKRAGDVIPRLEAPVVNLRNGSETPVVTPDVCPRCATALNKSDVVWRCPNGRKCGLVESLSHAVSREALNIDGLGVKVIEQLVENGTLSDVSDLYKLKPEDLSGLDRVGLVLSRKILDGINDSKNVELSRVISALGIRLIGKGIARRLATSFNSLKDFSLATVEDLSKIDGVGVERADVIIAELDELRDVIDRLILFGVGSSRAASSLKSTKLLGEVIVITGALNGALESYSRDAITSVIEQLGGKTSSAVSSKTTILVAGSGSGSKLSKAKALGIRVLTPDEFYELIK